MNANKWLVAHSQVYFSIVDVTSPEGDEWTATRNTKDGGIDWWNVGRYPHDATRTPAIPSAVKTHAELLLDAVAALPFDKRAEFCAEHHDDWVAPQSDTFREFFNQNDR